MSDFDLPRVLDRQIATAYCSLTPSGLSAWVRGTKRWDRRAPDAALDRISGLDRTAGEVGSAGDDASPLDA